jgi:hypothetical protein
MNEYIRSAIFLLNEPIPFAAIKPLYCSTWHSNILLS